MALKRSRDVVAITATCEQMMLVAVEKIKKRLLSAQNINPRIIRSQISRCLFTDLSFLKLFSDKLTLLEDQY